MKKDSGYTLEQVDRYTSWVLEFGVTKAQELQKEVLKNLKKFKKIKK